MPLLPAEIGDFLQRVKDDLRYGQDRGAYASLSTPSTAAGGFLEVSFNEFGNDGNAWTVEFTLPGGSTALTVTPTGPAIVVALAVTVGVATAAANTLALVAAAINAAVPEVTARYRGAGSSEITAAVGVASLAGGLNADTSVNTAPVGAGYLRAQDMATVLELLQEAATPGTLTATGGSTTTAVIAAAGTNDLIGAVVVFDPATTTAALRGETAIVKSNTATTLTFDRTLPAAVANTDTFALQPTLADRAKGELLDSTSGQSRGDSPRGSVYGEWRTVIDAMQTMAEQLGGAALPNRVVSRPGLTTSGTSTTTEIAAGDSDMKIDRFKGHTLTIAGQTRRIVRNSESTILLAFPLSGAPADATAYSIQLATASGDRFPGNFNLTHPGGSADSAFISYLLDLVQAAVEAYVLPA